MALIEYRPKEGLLSRMITVVTLLALGLLGFFQLYFFLAGLWSKSLGSEDEKLDVAGIDQLIAHADDIRAKLDRSYITIAKSSYSLVVRRPEREPDRLSLDTIDPVARDRVEEIKREITRGRYQVAQPIYQRVQVAAGPRALNQNDITRILSSDESPETVTVLGDPRPMLISQLQERVGKELYAAGATAPFLDAAASSRGKFSSLVLKLPDMRAQMQVSQSLPQNKVVTAVAIEANADKEIPALPVGSPIEEKLLDLISKFDPSDTVTLKHVDEGEFLEVPVSLAQDGSVLGAPIYAPTLISLEETITVGAEVLVERGTLLTAEHLDMLAERGYEGLLVRVDKVNLPPAEAEGMEPAEEIKTTIQPGTRLDAELLELVAASHGGDTQVQVASVQVKVPTTGDAGEATKRLEGRKVSASKVLPEAKVLAKADEDPLAGSMTIADYWHETKKFNKGYPEDARWLQHIDSRPLRVRTAGDPVDVVVPDSTAYLELEGYMLAESIPAMLPEKHSAYVEGLQNLVPGRVTTPVDAQQIQQALSLADTPNTFKAWKVDDLGVDVLADYSDGPDREFTFKAFSDAAGDQLISDGVKLTAAQLLAVSNIDRIAAAIAADDENLLQVELQDGTGVSFHTLDYFRDEESRWQKVLLLDEDITVEVPRVLIEAGVVLDAERIASLLPELSALPEEEQFLTTLGACEGVEVSALEPSAHEVCDQPLAVTLPADTALTATTVQVLVGAGVPEISLRGGRRTLPLGEIRSRLEGGAGVEALIPVKEGGEKLAEKGDPLTPELLALCVEKGLTELTVSGTKVDKRLVELEPGDMPGSAEGIIIREPLLMGDEPVVKNTEVDEDLIERLADLRETDQLAYPVIIESPDPQSPDIIRIDGDDSFGQLQRAVPINYFLEEGINLPGPLSGRLFNIGSQYSANWAGVLVVGSLLLFLFLLFRLVNHKKLTDLLVDTESEMRKVSWPTREDLVGSSQVVIVTVVLLAVFMLAADWILDWLMGWILVE